MTVSIVIIGNDNTGGEIKWDDACETILSYA